MNTFADILSETVIAQVTVLLFGFVYFTEHNAVLNTLGLRNVVRFSTICDVHLGVRLTNILVPFCPVPRNPLCVENIQQYMVRLTDTQCSKTMTNHNSEKLFVR